MRIQIKLTEQKLHLILIFPFSSSYLALFRRKLLLLYYSRLRILVSFIMLFFVILSDDLVQLVG